jgi:hypothetical protein
MSLETPSFEAGYATHAAVSEAPTQWNGLAGLCVPYLGMQGNVLYDLSASGHPGNLINVVPGTAWAPTIRCGEGVWGLTLDGTTSYVDFVDTALFDFPDTSFTVATWIKTAATPSTNGYLLNKRDTTGTWGGWMIRINVDGTITARILGPVAPSVAAERISVAACADGLWHLVTVAFTTDTVTAANNTLAIYIDGLLSQGSLTQSGDPYLASTVSAKIGVEADLLAGSYFNGSIDDVRIYGRELTAQEVWEAYVDSYAMLRIDPWFMAVGVLPRNYFTRVHTF